MSQQLKNGTTKKRGRPATGRGTQVQVRLQPDLLDSLDAVRAEYNLKSRPDAARFILRDWFIGHGYTSAESEQDK